jgi:hypothetical protein
VATALLIWAQLRIADRRFFRYKAAMPSREKLSEFTAWCRKNITGDEKGEAQIFLDRLFIAFGHPGSLDVGGEPEFAYARRLKTAAARALPIMSGSQTSRVIASRRKFHKQIKPNQT